MGIFFVKLWDFICQLPPFVIIGHYQLAVRLRFGKYTVSLGPGIHWRVPILHDILACQCKEQPTYLPVQVVNGLAVSGLLRYEIVDARLAMLEVQDFDECLTNCVMGLIAERLFIGDDIKPRELVEEIREDLDIQAAEWGLSITEFRLSTYTPARAFRLLGDSS